MPDELVGFLSEVESLDGELTIPKTTVSLGIKSITANGTYRASDEGLDGFSRVAVSVGDTVEITMSDCTFTDTNSDGNIVITEE